MSNQVRLIALLVVALLFSACATPYEAKVTSGLFGSREGFREVQLQGSPDRPDEEAWQVEFRGDNDTNLETAQAYGLYRSATLAIERGYDGFEIVSSLYQLSAISNPLYHKAQWVLLVPFPPPRTMFLAVIRLLKRPFEPNPPKVFDAAALKVALEPYVMGEKCGLRNNVCSHPHEYLRPIPNTSRL